MPEHPLGSAACQPLRHCATRVRAPPSASQLPRPLARPATTSAAPSPPLPRLLAPAVYSLVKFAGVTNYIVAVWTEEALGACADLNLPCTDIRPLVEARGLPEEKQRGQFVTWTRHIVAERVLEKGLAMHFMGEGAVAERGRWLDCCRAPGGCLGDSWEGSHAAASAPGNVGCTK